LSGFRYWLELCGYSNFGYLAQPDPTRSTLPLSEPYPCRYTRTSSLNFCPPPKFTESSLRWCRVWRRIGRRYFLLYCVAFDCPASNCR